ncbi:MAG: NAD(P)H-dependent glycerol-3-phosphate dehydrogenase, partial [Bacteroidota bacterium]
MTNASNTATPVSVLGAGSWGTALAYSLAAHGGHPVTLYARREDQAAAIRRERRNTAYLPGALLPSSIAVTSDLAEACGASRLWVVATPSQSVRGMAEAIRDLATPAHTLISVAKGIENGTLLTTSGVLRDVLPAHPAGHIGVLYGPSHAEEVAAGQPTTVVVSMPDLDAARAVQQVFMAHALRVYRNHDLVGVEIAGSVKNVMAIAAGMSDGVGLGDNAKAALVTRGLAEIKRLGLAMGAEAATFAGLAGLGDLVVTCFSKHSRNRYVGEQVGRGRSLADIEAEMTMVA